MCFMGEFKFTTADGSVSVDSRSGNSCALCADCRSARPCMARRIVFHMSELIFLAESNSKRGSRVHLEICIFATDSYFPAPQGHNNLAQRFSAGWRQKIQASPGGTIQCRIHTRAIAST